MTIARRLKDDRNWQSLHLVLNFPPHPTLTSYDRSLEDIGARALALSEKGNIARVLDKQQDSAEVITLVERLRQAILVYQVSAGDLQNQGLLTPGTDVTTTVNIQPGHPFNCEFLPPVFGCGTEPVISSHPSMHS